MISYEKINGNNILLGKGYFIWFEISHINKNRICLLSNQLKCKGETETKSKRVNLHTSLM